MAKPTVPSLRTDPPPLAAPPVPTPARPSLALRVLGWALLTWSVGLVSCQSLFFW